MAVEQQQPLRLQRGGARLAAQGQHAAMWQVDSYILLILYETRAVRAAACQGAGAWPRTIGWPIRWQHVLPVKQAWAMPVQSKCAQ